MSDYTPTTEYACEKYVQAMRQAFVASAGEHREEFDRMIAEVERAAAARALSEIAKDSAALEEAARDGMNRRGGPYPWNAAKGVRDMLHARAAEIREGA